MQQKLNEINNETGGIMNSLKNIEGQMIFFGQLILDMEDHPNEMASYVEMGIIQKQLNAIYSLFYGQLKEIKECQENIFKLSDTRQEGTNE